MVFAPVSSRSDCLNEQNFSANLNQKSPLNDDFDDDGFAIESEQDSTLTKADFQKIFSERFSSSDQTTVPAQARTLLKTEAEPGMFGRVCNIIGSFFSRKSNEQANITARDPAAVEKIKKPFDSITEALEGLTQNQEAILRESMTYQTLFKKCQSLAKKTDKQSNPIAVPLDLDASESIAKKQMLKLCHEIEDELEGRYPLSNRNIQEFSSSSSHESKQERAIDESIDSQTIEALGFRLQSGVKKFSEKIEQQRKNVTDLALPSISSFIEKLTVETEISLSWIRSAILNFDQTCTKLNQEKVFKELKNLSSIRKTMGPVKHASSKPMIEDPSSVGSSSSQKLEQSSRKFIWESGFHIAPEDFRFPIFARAQLMRLILETAALKVKEAHYIYIVGQIEEKNQNKEEFDRETRETITECEKKLGEFQKKLEEHQKSPEAEIKQGEKEDLLCEIEMNQFDIQSLEAGIEQNESNHLLFLEDIFSKAAKFPKKAVEKEQAKLRHLMSGLVDGSVRESDQDEVYDFDEDSWNTPDNALFFKRNGATKADDSAVTNEFWDMGGLTNIQEEEWKKMQFTEAVNQMRTYVGYVNSVKAKDYDALLATMRLALDNKYPQIDRSLAFLIEGIRKISASKLQSKEGLKASANIEDVQQKNIDQGLLKTTAEVILRALSNSCTRIQKTRIPFELEIEPNGFDMKTYVFPEGQNIDPLAPEGFITRLKNLISKIPSGVCSKVEKQLQEDPSFTPYMHLMGEFGLNYILNNQKE